MELQKILSLEGASYYLKKIIDIGIWKQLFNLNISTERIKKLNKLNKIIYNIQNKQLEVYLKSKVGNFKRKEVIKLSVLINKNKYKNVSERLKLGNEVSGLLEILLVKQKLVKKVITNPTKTNVYNLYQQVGKDGLGLLLISLLNSQNWKEKLGSIKQVIKCYNQSQVINPPQILNGKDLIRELDLEAGPIVGKVLNEIKLAQIQGKISNYQEAIKWAKGLVNNY